MKELLELGLHVASRLLNGHYQYKSQMAQLQAEYELERERIRSDAALECKRIDATLQYALADLEHKQRACREQFAIVIKELENVAIRDIDQQISHIIQLSQNLNIEYEMRLLALRDTVPALLHVKMQAFDQRHNLLLAALTHNSQLLQTPIKHLGKG